MSIKIWQGGTLRTISSIRVKSGGALRTIRSIRIMSGGSLRTVYTAASSMTASATALVTGDGNGSGTQTVTTELATCTPSGGTGPYTYSWARISADPEVSTAAADSPTFATTSFSATVAPANVGTATFRCTVTDSLGAEAESNLVTATFGNVSEEAE